MSLPVYFVQPPGLPPPPGKCCLCGWFAEKDGSLHAPPEPEQAQALVFDDRNALPENYHHIIEELLNAKSEIGAALLLLDFERVPTRTSLSFVKALSTRSRVAAPEYYCLDCAAEPIFCYCPAKEAFDAFRQRIAAANAWLEFRPVDDTIFYPLPGVSSSEPSVEFFSEVLQCHYTATSTSDGFILHLYDTQESIFQRVHILSSQLKAVVGLRSELDIFGIRNAIK